MVERFNKPCAVVLARGGETVIPDVLAPDCRMVLAEAPRRVGIGPTVIQLTVRLTALSRCINEQFIALLRSDEFRGGNVFTPASMPSKSQATSKSPSRHL